MEELILINDAKVDEALVSKIIEQAALTQGKILLRLMDGCLPDNNAGSTTPRSLLKYYQNFHMFDNYLNHDWEIGIAISGKYCLSYNSFPAYFSYLLGHELGHAAVCINDLDLHVFYCLIQGHIKKASAGNVTAWHQLPHEIIFDRFGLYIAEMIYGREKTDRDIKLLLADRSRKDLNRLEQMLRLNGSKDLGNLWKDLLNFARPYKDELIKCFEEDVFVLGDKALAYYFDNLNQLFD